MSRSYVEKWEFDWLARLYQEVPWIRFRNNLIAALVKKRSELGLSSKEMADALKTNEISVNRFEYMSFPKKGIPIKQPTPTLRFAAMYADALGMEIAFQLVPKTDAKGS